jgi:hypothetical protein
MKQEEKSRRDDPVSTLLIVIPSEARDLQLQSEEGPKRVTAA